MGDIESNDGVPVACTLGADELPTRLAQIRAIGRDALLSVDAGHARFRSDPTARARLEGVIAAESECCSFLSFDLREDAGELVLTVGAPNGAEQIAAGLLRAFAGDT